MVLKIKNIIIFSILLLVFSIPVFAQNYNEIISYSEKVLPDGDDALISASVTATSNDSNEVYVPLNKKAKLIRYTITPPSVSADPEQIRINGKNVYKFVMSEKQDKYQIELQYKLPGVYKGKKAKMKGSHPGGVKTVTYKFVNNLPVTMKSYQVHLYIPEKKELYHVLTPAKKYKINADNTGKYVSYAVSKIGGYGNITVSANVYSQSAKVKIVIWIAIILLSVFLLMKRVDVIKN
jgi:hypothetical protein